LGAEKFATQGENRGRHIYDKKKREMKKSYVKNHGGKMGGKKGLLNKT